MNILWTSSLLCSSTQVVNRALSWWPIIHRDQCTCKYDHFSWSPIYKWHLINYVPYKCAFSANTIQTKWWLDRGGDQNQMEGSPYFSIFCPMEHKWIMHSLAKKSFFADSEKWNVNIVNSLEKTTNKDGLLWKNSWCWEYKSSWKKLHHPQADIGNGETCLAQ